MPELARFQEDFLHRIDRSPVAPALAVYRNTATLGAVNAIDANYPTVGRIVGPETMAALAGEFVGRFPPASPVLAGYGAEFACWLEAHPIADQLPYLAEVARIDRMRVEAHLAADACEFGLEDLVRLTADDWARCRVTLHPATRIGWFAIPAPTIWAAHFGRDPGEIAPSWQPEGILVTRSNGAVSGLVIGACTYRILEGLRHGETVGQAALAASRRHPADNITRAFRKIIASGALTSLKLKG